MAEAKASLLIILKDKVSKKLGVIGGKLKQLQKDLNKSKLLFGGLAAGVGFLGGAIISAADKMEQWTLSFTTMLGSADAAKTLMQEIKTFAAETPFELPGVIKGAKGLLAFGIEANKVIPTLKSLGDVAAGLGVPIDRLILNFGQIKAQTKLTGRELRDFAIAGVPLLAELAKNLNKTESEIQDMVSAGKIGFRDVETAFITMTSKGGRFANMMTTQMTTLSGIVSNVKDAFFRLASNLGSYLLPIVKPIAIRFLHLINFITNLSPKTKLLILVVGGLSSALAVLLGVATGLAYIMPALAAGFAVLTSPITLVIGAILTLGTVITAIVTNVMSIRDVLQNIFMSIGEAIILLAKSIKSALTFHFEEAKDNIKKAFSKIKDASVNAFDTIKDNISENINKIVGIIKSGSSKIIKIKKQESKKQFEITRKDWEIAKKFSDEEFARLQKQSKLQMDMEKQKAMDRIYWLDYVARASITRSNTLNSIFKAAAIARATINAYEAASKAWAQGGFFGAPMAAVALAAGLANVSKIAGIKLAEGGVVLPRAGGTIATLAEAGKPEVVIPLESERAKESLEGLSNNININVNVEGSIVSEGELARKMGDILWELRENKEIVL